MKQALIVTGGRIEPDFAVEYAGKYSFDLVIAVDSGLRYFYETGQKPDIAVGDFDSVKPEILHHFERQEGIEWIRLVPEKDDTDTEAAIRRAAALGCQSVHMLGATGSRLDHVLGNIQLLGIGLQEHMEILLVDRHNRIRMIRDALQIKKNEQYGKYVSLIPFTPQVKGLTLMGMKYPLEDYKMVCFNSLGVSNEIVEDTAEITMEDGILLVLETRD